MGDADQKAPEEPVKPVRWMGDSRRKLQSFPEDVKDDVGTALFWAQTGTKHPNAKPLLGLGGAHTLEIVENAQGNTYRVVYTVRHSARIYVLHCFQKKSRRGNQTPKHEIDLVKERLKQADQMESDERAQIAKS